MTDREKVVSEFERCIGSFSSADTSDEYFMCVCNRVLELLKEQEAVKPIVDQCALPLTTYTVQFIKKYYCGICHEEITGNNVYCHKCGRKVKWDE